MEGIIHIEKLLNHDSIKNGVAIEGVFKCNVQSGGASEAAQIQRVKTDDHLLVPVMILTKSFSFCFIRTGVGLRLKPCTVAGSLRFQL